MPLNLQREAFVAEIVSGKGLIDAYISAGYKARARNTAAVAAARLAKHPEVIEAIKRGREEKVRIRAEATKLAIERSAITMERVAVELGRIGFANMADYADIFDSIQDLSGWLKRLPREHAAALSSLHLTDHGGVRFTLGDKRASLMDIAKLFGWIIERRENKIVDEFDSMSLAEVEAWLDEQAERRVKMRRRASAEMQRHGHQDAVTDDGAGQASLISRGSGREQTGRPTEMGGR
jgi:hypothetical protein